MSTYFLVQLLSIMTCLAIYNSLTIYYQPTKLLTPTYVWFFAISLICELPYNKCKCNMHEFSVQIAFQWTYNLVYSLGWLFSFFEFWVLILTFYIFTLMDNATFLVFSLFKLHLTKCMIWFFVGRGIYFPHYLFYTLELFQNFLLSCCSH